MRLQVIAVVCTTVLMASLPAASQIESSELTDELRGIRTALERLVVLQEAERRQTAIEILLKRIELHERRIEPLQRELSSTEHELDDVEENQRSLESMLEQNQDRLRTEIDDGIDDPYSDTRRMIEDIERTLKTQRERLDERALRVRRLEADLAAASESIDRLDARLADRLDEDER